MKIAGGLGSLPKWGNSGLGLVVEARVPRPGCGEGSGDDPGDDPGEESREASEEEEFSS